MPAFIMPDDIDVSSHGSPSPNAIREAHPRPANTQAAAALDGWGAWFGEEVEAETARAIKDATGTMAEVPPVAPEESASGKIGGGEMTFYADAPPADGLIFHATEPAVTEPTKPTEADEQSPAAEALEAAESCELAPPLVDGGESVEAVEANAESAPTIMEQTSASYTHKSGVVVMVTATTTANGETKATDGKILLPQLVDQLDGLSNDEERKPWKARYNALEGYREQLAELERRCIEAALEEQSASESLKSLRKFRKELMAELASLRSSPPHGIRIVDGEAELDPEVPLVAPAKEGERGEIGQRGDGESASGSGENASGAPGAIDGTSSGSSSPTDPADDAEAWRSVSIDNLNPPLAPGTRASLHEAGLHTMGDVADFTAQGKHLQDLKGIGQKKAEKACEVFEHFWTARIKAEAAAGEAERLAKGKGTEEVGETPKVEESASGGVSDTHEPAGAGEPDANENPAPPLVDQVEASEPTNDPASEPEPSEPSSASGGESEVATIAIHYPNPADFDDWPKQSRDNYWLATAARVNTGADNSLTPHLADHRHWESGGEAYGRRFKLTDCPHFPGPEADDWVRGWLGARALAEWDGGEEGATEDQNEGREGEE